MPQRFASAGCSRMGAPVMSARAGAASMWSSCPCVDRMPTTFRLPTPHLMAWASWAASMTRTSLSSPISQTLLSTSHVPPSSENVPEVTTLSIRAATVLLHPWPPAGRQVGRPGLHGAPRMETSDGSAAALINFDGAHHRPGFGTRVARVDPIMSEGSEVFRCGQQQPLRQVGSEGTAHQDLEQIIVRPGRTVTEDDDRTLRQQGLGAAALGQFVEID